MITVQRGGGVLVPVFGVVLALGMNVLLAKVVDGYYYQEHKWPKLTVLLLAGFCCLIAGLLLKQKRVRDVEKEQRYVESLSPKFKAVKDLAFSGPRDHLMYIPLPYWSLVYFAAAIVYAFW